MLKTFKIMVAVAVIFAVTLVALPRLNAAVTSTLKYNPKKTTLYKPQIKDIADVLTLSGSVATDQIANVRFLNSGKLVWVGVHVGDHVRRGQALASLDQAELKKNLQTQFNNYESQRSTFDDTQDQYKDKVITDTIKRILVRTQNSLDNTVINYEIADMAIKEATIVSPMDGILIAADQPLAGANITPATATFTVVNPDALYFKANIDQEAVTKVHSGDPVKLSLDAFPDKTFDSAITYIAFTPVSGETSTVYEVRFKLPVDNKDLSYRLGMDGDVDLTLQQSPSALTIRADSLYDDNGQNYVYVKSGDELVRKNIKIGIETDTDVEVKEGISPNDQVAVIQK